MHEPSSLLHALNQLALALIALASHESWDLRCYLRYRIAPSYRGLIDTDRRQDLQRVRQHVAELLGFDMELNFLKRR
jgi:hypothetical protein